MTIQDNAMIHFDALLPLQKTVFRIIQRLGRATAAQITAAKFGPFAPTIEQKVNIRHAIKQLVQFGFVVELTHEGTCTECDAYVEHGTDEYEVTK